MLESLVASCHSLTQLSQEFGVESSVIAQLKEGIDAQSSDIFLGDSGCIALFPSGLLAKTVLFFGAMDEGAFGDSGFDRFHLYYCDRLRAQTEKLRFYPLRIQNREEPLFHFSIMRGRQTVKSFYDKPLEVCPECKAIFESTVQKTWSYSKYFEVMPEDGSDELSRLGVYGRERLAATCQQCGKTIEADEKAAPKIEKMGRFGYLRYVCAQCQ